MLGATIGRNVPTTFLEEAKTAVALAETSGKASIM